MKHKTKYVIIITIVLTLLLLLSLSTFSNAITNFEVTNVDVTVIDTKAKIQWDKANEADGYEVYVDIPYIGYVNLGNVSTNTVNIIGFKTGETYGIKVIAYKYENNTKKYSDFSSEVRFEVGKKLQTTSKLGKVTDLKAISYGDNGVLEWNSVKEAKGYEVFANIGNCEFVLIGTTEDTKVKIIGMNKEQAYGIKIRPYLEESGERIYGSLSDLAILKYEEEKIEEKPGKVTNLRVTMNGNSAKLQWNEVNDVDGYEIAVKIPGKQDAIYYSSSNLKYLENFSSHYTYNARVRAYKYINGQKEYGDYSNYVSIRYEKEVETVQNLRVTMNKDKATFNWNKVNGADGYEIVVNIPGIGDCTYTETSTSRIMSGFTDKEHYYTVKVRAYEYINGYKEYGEYSNKAYFRNEEKEEIGQVTGLKVTMNKDKATFNWNKVNGADGYEIVVNIPGIGDCTYTEMSTTRIMSGFTDKEYYYTVKVRAYEYINGYKEYGKYSNKAYFRNEEKIGQVTGLKVTMNGSKATFNWNKINEADGYEIVVNIPGIGDCKYMQTSTSRYMTGFTQKEDYYTIKVRAYKYINGKIEYGDYSDKAYFKNEEKEEIGKVTGLKVSRNNKEAIFSWNKINGVNGYEIVVNIPGIGDCKYRETSTTRYMTGFTQTKYKYTIKVRAYKYVNGKIEYGDYSNIVNF